MKQIAAFALILISLGPAAFAEKFAEQATIRDVQPTNFGAARKKHQQYDFSILTAGRNYQCRTSEDKSFNATDFVVGSTVTFVSNGKKGEVKAANGKNAKCTITRVENAPMQ